MFKSSPLLALTCALMCAAPALAQPPRDFKTYQPSAAATRIDASEAPVIDGDFSDPVWKKATTIDEFYQLEPHEGAPASERTVVKMAYDRDNLYFAIYAHDDEPKNIIAKIKARDGAIDKDDIIRIYLDPNMTRRNGYLFEVNPLGARREGLVQNNTDVLYNWNTLWSAKAHIVADGWVVEVAIPFRSISYDPARHDWGFDFFRLVRRKNERIRWSAINIAIGSQDISHSGTLTGISDVNEGVGLDAQLYAVAKFDRVWDKPGDADFSLKPSGNIYYKITPGMTGLVTFNTDFSDTPLDARKVNITRFALFYPETRDFFLQDAAAFEFGGLNLDPNADPNGQPFFSRNIGLVNLSPVNLQIGGKVSGQLGEFNIGALSVRTGRAPDGTPPQTLSVARATMPVMGESKLGLIFTQGDPSGLTHNNVGGGDFQYRNSDVFGGKTIQGDIYYERSSSSAVGDDDAYGFEVNFPNEPWNGYFRYKDVGANFDPALGFVSRPGIREYTGQVVRRERYQDSDVRWVETGMWWDWFTGLDNHLQTAINDAWVGAYLQQRRFWNGGGLDRSRARFAGLRSAEQCHGAGRQLSMECDASARGDGGCALRQSDHGRAMLRFLRRHAAANRFFARSEAERNIRHSGRAHHGQYPAADRARHHPYRFDECGGEFHARHAASDPGRI